MGMSGRQTLRSRIRDGSPVLFAVLALSALVASLPVRGPVVGTLLLGTAVALALAVVVRLWLRLQLAARRNRELHAANVEQEWALKTALAQQERYRRIVDEASDMIALYDTEGYFTFVNRKVCEVLGYTPEEARQLHVFQVVHPHAAAAGRESLRR